MIRRICVFFLLCSADKKETQIGEEKDLVNTLIGTKTGCKKTQKMYAEKLRIRHILELKHIQKNLNEKDLSIFLQNAWGISSTLKVNTGVLGSPSLLQTWLDSKIEQ